MIPVLLILGAGVALKIKRLTQRGGSNGQAQADKEQHLKKLLQVEKLLLDTSSPEHEHMKHPLLQSISCNAQI